MQPEKNLRNLYIFIFHVNYMTEPIIDYELTDVWKYLEEKYNEFMKADADKIYAELIAHCEELGENNKVINQRVYMDARVKVEFYPHLHKALKQKKIDAKFKNFYRALLQKWLFDALPHQHADYMDYTLFPKFFRKAVNKLSEWDEIHKIDFFLQGFFEEFFEDIHWVDNSREVYENIKKSYSPLENVKKFEEILVQLTTIESEFKEYL